LRKTVLVYLIDAFNVIHKVPQLKNSAVPRSDFANYISKNNLTGSVTNKVTIVFDGYPVKAQAPSGPYEILYSCDRSADDLIKKKAADYKNKSQLVVVTDDRAICDYMKELKVKLVSVNDFLNKAVKPGKNSEREELSDSLKKEITDVMRKIWDK